MFACAPCVRLCDYAQMNGQQVRGRKRGTEEKQMETLEIELTALHFTLCMVINVFTDGRLKAERDIKEEKRRAVCETGGIPQIS